MVFNAYSLSSDRYADIDTEIRFAVATARVEGAELLRFEIKREEDILKSFNSAVRIFKKMKSMGQIQFLATPSSFSNSDAEAEFLRNKYPEYLSAAEVSDKEAYIYVKL
jgi:hypothetical protein